jgi:hypothetical protein
VTFTTGSFRNHGFYRVKIDDEFWLFGRNYGPEYPSMPLPQREYMDKCDCEGPQVVLLEDD